MKHMVGRAGVILSAVLIVGAAVPTADSAVVPSGSLWASPSGQGTTCSKAKPCSIVEGFNKVDTGTLVLEPGHYGTTTSPLTAGFPVRAAADIEGEPGKPAPVIVLDTTVGSGAIYVLGASHLTLIVLDAGDGLVAGGGVVDHVAVFADTVATGVACLSLNALVTNSLCVNTGSAGAGLGVLSNNSVPITIEATTAVDTAPSARGVVVGNTTSSSSAVITMTNDIAHGGSGGDVAEAGSGSTTAADVTVNMSHCDAKKLVNSSTPQGDLTINHNSTDITAAPKFVSAAGDNFAERATSPTVNHGVANLLEGTTDLSGQRRVLGSHPDIGAYELAQPPAELRLKVLARHAHSVRLKVTLNPEGLPTRTTVSGRPVVKRSHHTVSGDKITSYDVTVTQLKTHRHYRLQVTAKNAGGSTHRTVATTTS